MTTETTTTVEDKTLAAQGATLENLDDSTTGKGPKAPAAASNEPPKKGDDEENTVVVVDPAKAAEEKAAADKAAADKAAADKEAAGPLKEYTKFDDSPAAQAAVNLLKEAGLGPNAANEYFAKALKSGDLNDVDVAGLEAKLGKDKATLVMAGVTAHYNGMKAQSEASVAKVLEVFGGEENWAVVRAWAQKTEKADPAFKAKVDDIRTMLDEGGFRADLGAKELLRMYNAAPDQKGLGTAKLAVGDSTGTVIGKALTRAEYVRELEAAHNRRAPSTEIKALDARRKAGMKAGI
jgi:hypothetical protein